MSQLDNVEVAIKSLEEIFINRIGELEAQLHNSGPAKDTVAKVAKELQAFKELMFSLLQLIRRQISECHKSIDMIEARHRRKALIFLGVPEVEKENCSTTILGILHNKMSLKDITATSITVCHRVGAPNGERPRPILVRLATLGLKSVVWRSKTALKGSSVAIRESITKTRQLVFNKSRQHFGLKNSWTQDGVVIIKTPDGSRHKITSVDELNPLLQKYPKAAADSVAVAKVGEGPTENINNSKKPRK